MSSNKRYIIELSERCVKMYSEGVTPTDSMSAYAELVRACKKVLVPKRPDNFLEYAEEFVALNIPTCDAFRTDAAELSELVKYIKYLEDNQRE